MTCWEETAEGSDRAAVKDIPDVAADAARSMSDGSGENATPNDLTKWQTDQLRDVLGELAECKKLLTASRG